MRPPASDSARVFCTPPAKPTRVARIREFSCNSPADDAADLAVPGQKYTFGIVKAAQARGDFKVLADRGRRALRVHLGADVESGLTTLGEGARASLCAS